MSFVGTRPEVTKYVKKYTKEMRASKVWGRDKNPDIVDAGKVCECIGKTHRSKYTW